MQSVSILCNSPYRPLILTRGLVKTNREVKWTFHERQHQKPLNLMELIYETWQSETAYSQPCIGFPNNYWLNYKPIVHSKQKIFCHLVNENAVYWWIFLGRRSYIPLKSTEPPAKYSTIIQSRSS